MSNRDEALAKLARKMSFREIQEKVQEVLDEAYKPKKAEGGDGLKVCGPHWADCPHIEEKGLTEDSVVFTQKGQTWKQGYNIKSGKAVLKGGKQQVMVTWAPVE
jgi:hypothetical protein